MQRLEDRVALITGGASGIGAATAHRLAAEGARVWITDIQDDKGHDVVARVRANGATIDYIHHDVANEQSWKHVIDAITQSDSRLDVLFNNAGIGEATTIEDTTWETYLHTIGITQHSVFLGMRACGELLKKSGHA